MASTPYGTWGRGNQSNISNHSTYMYLRRFLRDILGRTTISKTFTPCGVSNRVEITSRENPVHVRLAHNTRWKGGQSLRISLASCGDGSPDGTIDGILLGNELHLGTTIQPALCFPPAAWRRKVPMDIVVLQRIHPCTTPGPSIIGSTPRVIRCARISNTRPDENSQPKALNL